MPERDETEKGTDQHDAARAAFLYKIIDDNQGTIRSTDTKAAVGIAVLSAMAGKVLQQYPLLQPISDQPWAVILFLCLFSLFCVISAALAFRVVFPTINPYKNVRVPKDLNPCFFIAELEDESWLRLFSSSDRYCTLKETHAHYDAAVHSATIGDLISILSAEVLKLSFIRQIKLDRLIAFARVLVVTVAIFLVFIVLSSPPLPSSQSGQRAPSNTSTTVKP